MRRKKLVRWWILSMCNLLAWKVSTAATKSGMWLDHHLWSIEKDWPE